MKYTQTPLIFLISLFMLTACGGSSSTASPDQEAQNTAITDPQLAGKLKRSTESGLTDYFRQVTQQTPASINETIFLQASTTTSNSTASNTNVSTTNIQESGVDEADLLKTTRNGHYIYGVAKASIIARPPILNSNSGDNSSDSNAPDTINNSDSIRIMDAQNTPLTEVKRLVSADAAWRISGLYLDNTEEKLIALSSNNTDYHLNWFNSHYFAQQSTEILFFDIANPSSASLTHTLSFDGNVVASRRNGDVLYLVLRHFPDYVYNQNNPQDNMTATDLLPHYRLNQSDKQPVVLAENCYQEEDRKSSADIITLVAINLVTDTPEMKSQCYVGSAEAIYASQQALYLATTTSTYQTQNDTAVYKNTMTTDIHKFAYNAMDFDYRGSGEVSGHLGYQQNRKSFRFSEHNGILRVVTFAPEQWSSTTEDETTTSNKSPVLLTLLEENNTQQALKTIAQLPNATRPTPIGLPEEKLYASRFIGDKAYFVTFRVTDPLYVIDLSNPTDPFIAGELKIEGYSDYLQPISETLLLGIGKDAIPSDSTDGIGDGRGAWHQGVKLSLIDVSDPTNPREADKYIIGKRGTESTALYNHHALTSLKTGDTQRIALPIRLHETELTNSLTTPHPSQYYGHTNTGLYRFEIDLNNQIITEKPAIITSENPATSNSFVIDNDRSVMIDDAIHYLYNDSFKSQVW